MECIFCDIVTKKASSWMIYQDEYISAFFDYFPASKWHVMVVPNKHYANIFEIPDEIISKIWVLSKKISIFYKENLWVEDINIIQSNWKLAWQEVFHYHMHLIPRSENDKMNFHWDYDENIRDEYDELKEFIANWIK